jgi:hypothetical protein
MKSLVIGINSRGWVNHGIEITLNHSFSMLVTGNTKKFNEIIIDVVIENPLVNEQFTNALNSITEALGLTENDSIINTIENALQIMIHCWRLGHSAGHTSGWNAAIKSVETHGM